MSLNEALDALFAAEKESQRWYDDLANRDRDALLTALRRALDEAEAKDDAPTRLVALARLFGELQGPKVADALIDILNSEYPEVRREAGEHLQGLASEQFKEVALAVERALVRLPAGSVALIELPFVLMEPEFAEAGVATLFAKFLDHDDPDVVGAALEGIAEIGDPSVMNAVRRLEGDRRTTALNEKPESIADLAADALAELEEAAAR